MHIGKTWIFILLFSLSLNFCVESVQSHGSDFDSIHVHMSDSTDSDYTHLCDNCHNCHVKMASSDLDGKIPHIHITKPHFEQQDSFIISSTTQLFKPPIS